jgi:hypothetical protein
MGSRDVDELVKSNPDQLGIGVRSGGQHRWENNHTTTTATTSETTITFAAATKSVITASTITSTTITSTTITILTFGVVAHWHGAIGTLSGEG